MARRFNFINATRLYREIKAIIERERTEIDALVKKYYSNEVFRGVVIGDHKVIGLYPVCSIVPGDIPIKPFGTNWTFEIHFAGQIAVYTKGVAREGSYEFQWELTQLILEIMLDPVNSVLRIDDPDKGPEAGFVYDFNVFQGIQQGIEEKDIRYSKIGFEAKQVKQHIVSGINIPTR